MSDKIKIGLIINPIAGMGGSVGLKGSDGAEILALAREKGAIPNANQRAKEFLQALNPIKSKISFLTVEGIMGGDLVNALGFNVEFIPSLMISNHTQIFTTTPNDTIFTAREMKNRGITLLMFVGGDGTARNIFEAVGDGVPCLGIPGGVKIHSAVFATTPIAAAQLILQYLWGEAPLREAEVLDIDEDAFRHNSVVAKLYGYLSVPYSPTFSQPSKMSSPESENEIENQQGIARWLIEEMERLGDSWYFLVGPGTTPRSIAILLSQPKTLLGVDLFHQKRQIKADLNEKEIIEAIEGKKVKLIVTPIGAQGFIFGRGNLQLSSHVLRKVGFDNIIIIASKYKISTIPNNNLRIDSRDPDFDKEFVGYYRVLVDYGEFRIINVVS